MIALAVLAACLFPLAPYQIKIVVVYLSMGILVTLIGAILIRGAIAGLTWMAVGRSFWLLPNVLSEVQSDRPCSMTVFSEQTGRSIAIQMHSSEWGLQLLIRSCFDQNITALN